jgi:hypothetical protein
MRSMKLRISLRRDYKGRNRSKGGMIQAIGITLRLLTMDRELKH